MNKEKMLILCPRYHPENDGLSDYTTLFSEHLCDEFEVGVLTNINSKKRKDSQVRVYSLMEKWNLRAFINILLPFVKRNKFDHLLIQYVPYLYGKAGINFSFPLIILLLRKLYPKLNISIMCHELWYPFIFGQWKSWIIHSCHRYSMTLLVYSSDHVFCSTEYFLKVISYYYPLKKESIFHLPVSSNIGGNTRPKVKRIDYKCFRLLHFGQFHPSKDSLRLFRKLAAYDFIDIELSFIGVDREDAINYLGLDTVEKMSSYTRYLGKISEREVIEEFVKSDLLLAYFLDGATTRRGSLLAAMKYGLQILTPVSDKTDQLLRDAPLCFSKCNIDDYLIELEKIINNEKSNSLESQKIAEYFSQYFSWQKIIYLFKSHVKIKSNS